jgi:hypothetical protein
MPKILKPTQKDKCTGCELCVFEAQRQLKKVGLEGSLIRIFRKKSPDNEKILFDLELDPRINILNVEKIASICPKHVMEVLDKKEDD